MSAFLGDDGSVACQTVVNHLGQYSIWPAGREVPDGWRASGFSGTRDACLAHIDAVWPEPISAYSKYKGE
ncbi:MbtH protein [Kibdelosporangium banguiense]|uniref:MbtH protein n=1 Tax=Kibdelosporangium banguiense TaxID=1365924 RepID=A0ABS4TYC3_9PSEU|nr:MbtH family protein [Kibdelosporangium banguiense]MBP2329397.1 MbtH protein [Kibdelosporangium banguiense]